MSDLPLNPIDFAAPAEATDDPAAFERDKAEHDEPAMSHLDKSLHLAVVVLPFLGLIAAMVSLWGYGFGWQYLVILVVGYLLTAVGITVGFHRLFTHKSFETPTWVSFTFGVLGSMALEGPLFKWTAQHRLHHQHSDGAEDPHSPHHGHGEGFKALVKGFWHSHVGWIFNPDIPNIQRYIPDLTQSKSLKIVNDWFPLWAVLGLVLPAVAGGLMTMSWAGVGLGFLWGTAVRIFLVHHVTWSINSVCHIWGSRDFRSHDESRNNLIFGILGMGEGWHNNHHAFPTSARHGLKWWQFDASYLLIKAMEKVGLAWKVRVPAKEQMERKRVGVASAPATPTKPA